MNFNREQLRTITGGGRVGKFGRTLSIASFVGEGTQPFLQNHSMINLSSGISEYDLVGYTHHEKKNPKVNKKNHGMSIEQPRSAPMVNANKKTHTSKLTSFFKRSRKATEDTKDSEHDDKHKSKNDVLCKFMESGIDLKGVMMRLVAFFHSISIDKDQQRMHGEYYNNIYLGKRMFGPARKQKFLSTITGGMERRFEILDSQVEYQPFNHLWSDRNPKKCRNPQVPCKDDTRVQLPCVDDENGTNFDNAFIHANWVGGGPLFNDFIVTQAPMDYTIGDFWRMVWAERVSYIFMLIGKNDTSRCAAYWPRDNGSPYIDENFCVENLGVDDTTDPLFRITTLKITNLKSEDTFTLCHWQADMNDSNDLEAPLRLLHVARNCSKPVIVHDCLGISRAGCLVAIEAAICSLIRGPTYRHTIQTAIQFIRSKRPFCVETPTQYIYVTRCVLHFFERFVGEIPQLQNHYKQWLEQRATRMFLDFDDQLSGHTMLSPRVDPDLLKQVRKPSRNNLKCETATGMGELPLPLSSVENGLIAARRRIFPNKYPAGKKY